jgi:hypothetical protein
VIYYKQFKTVLEMKKEKKLLLFLILVLVGALLFSSVPASAGANPSRGKSLAEARKALEQELLPLAGAGFVGIAHSEADGEVIVFVEDEQAKQRMPRSFNGYAVQTEVTGKIQAFSTQVAEPLADVGRKDEVRPLVGGTSLSAYIPSLYYAGTLGMVTYKDDNKKILSNTHVIAMNPQTGAFLSIGTTILQPGSGDGGSTGDRVGALEAYIPINFTPNAENYADAAIGSIDGSVSASPGEQFCEGGNYWVGGWTEVSTGNIVRKSGRTTGVTTGEVLYTDASVTVHYYGGKSAYFVDQIVVEQENWSFAKSGDSGSAVDKDGKFVGLLFAGTADRVVICKAEHIIDGLGISVEPPVGQYSLTISSTPGGSVTIPGEGSFPYDADEVVSLVAVADEHYHFVEWTGDVSTVGNVTAAATSITMSNSYSITANFELDSGWYSLTTSSTEGGLVTQPGEGTYVHGNYTTVNLVAEADLHYHFVEWSGNVSTVGNATAAATNITMNDSYSITANFELDTGWYSLTISSTDGGSVTTPGEGTHVYGNSTVVDLVAVPATHYSFVEWTGDVGNIADVHSASTNITMSDSYSITANFETYPQPTAQLTVSSTTGGSVTAPGEGTFSYPLGAEVSLVAEAVSGYQFTNWSGDVGTIADINAASTTITMDSPCSIRANFSGAGWCFIATAAYGTPMAEEIGILREFRDEYLLTNAVGQILVDFYYRVSPPVAEFITEHPSLKPIVRAVLLPAVTMSTIAVNTTPVEKVVVVGLLALVSVALAAWATRWRDKGPEYP